MDVSLEEGVSLSLPLKIAGLVFWGLAFIGLILVVLSINWLEKNLPQQHENINYQTYTQTQELFLHSKPLSPKNLKLSLREIIKWTGAEGLKIIAKDKEIISVGNTDASLNVKTIYFSMLPINEKHTHDNNEKLLIYQPHIKEVLNQQKKQLITIMFVALFIFGILLQWVLKKLLSTPIQQMIDTAQTFSLGEDVRFNDERSDEFGYISRFINKALSNLTHRQEELSYQASHDKLTGLYNRHEFDIRLNQSLNLAKHEDLNSTLCYMDLDQFKIINDTCGHIAGDELLKQISSSLKSELRESDFIARLGGDEFGVLLQGCAEEDAIRLATKLLHAVDKFHFAWEGKTFHVGVSIGVAAITNDAASAHDILSLADVACYTAKDKGRNQIHIYQPNDQVLKRKRGDMLWASQIRDALKNNTFSLYQQLIIPTDPTSTHKKHYEILLRIPDGNGKLTSPMKYIGAAELYGLMTKIDDWVIKNCFKWITNNKKAMRNIEQISINLSGQSLSSRQFSDTTITLLETTKIDLSKICFEITETNAISNYESAIDFIYKIKSYGCKFALDDFGSGMSSFSYLKTLNVDYLKIDGSYVHNIVNNPIDCAMVEAVNKIGQAMGIETIAEYVEDQDVLNMLAKIGVNYAQGYGIAHPAPLDDLIKEH